MRFIRKKLLRHAGPVLGAVLALMATSAAATTHSAQIICHYTYGGETKQLVALPVSSPYAAKGIAVGSFFHFRLVFQEEPADLASIKVYTYAQREDGPLLIHQATYPYPPIDHAAAPYGFSGLQFVYEPMRDGELQYWCELSTAEKSAGSAAQ
ncbi:hypothetical protein [Propionivibrio sp.]|uniref:hypothetical protein n=1 Tax=Propionivibrio sp. TaxID=2212460 RepID=UPI003BEFF8A9